MRLSRDCKIAAKKLKLLSFTSKKEVVPFRVKIEEQFTTRIIPNHVEYRERVYGGINCGLLEPEIYSSQKIMIYVHGGSFIGGSCRSWRNFCASQSNVDSCRIIIPNYRLAPQFAYPAAVEDLQTVFKTVYMEEQVARTLDPQLPAKPEILIGADGAGSSIALALILNLKAKFRKSISRLILFSPWLDISKDSPVFQAKSSADPVMSADVVQRSGNLYTYETNLKNPLVSPLYAEKEHLNDFPPVFMQMGENEILLPDAKKFQQKLLDAEIDCELDIWPGMIHLFQMTDDVPESHLALEKVGNIVTGCTSRIEKRKASEQPILEQSLNSDA